MAYSERKHTRLKCYDYAAEGYYYFTICAWQKKCLFGSVIQDRIRGNTAELSAYGRILETELLAIPQRFPFAYVDKYIIMPNHVHLILRLLENPTGEKRAAAQFILGTVKSLTMRGCRGLGYTEAHLFQTSMYDHVIRNEADYRRAWAYIDGNPQKWFEDPEYRGNP